MTNKEAIKYLQQLYPNGGHCWLDEQRIEAIGMAIKALQKEPKECMYSKDNYTDEDRKVLCEGCEDECIEKMNEERKSDLSLWSLGDFEKKFFDITKPYKDSRNYKNLCIRLVMWRSELWRWIHWKKRKEDSASDELEKVVEEIVDPTVLNAYGVKEIANRLRRTIIESVSEEQVKESLISKHDDKTCKENGDSLTQEPVSEDMWKASKQYALRQVLASTDAEMSEQDYLGLRLFSGFELAVAHKDGAQLQKQQMMNNAITAEYWDNSLMLDAEMRGKYSDGNKVKLIIIKEE